MIGKNNNAQQKPTALDVMTQASSYGAVIAPHYGLTRAPLYGIWLANLRQGNSGKKGKKAGKKGAPPDWVAAVDFLIGLNPIQSVFRAWRNNEPRFDLNMANVAAFDISAPGAGPNYTITDPLFYAVIAVTLTMNYDVTFDDYGGFGSDHETGNFEVPLVNSYILGPDPNQPPAARYYPFTYSWNPNFGPTVHLDGQDAGGVLPAGQTLRIYYASFSASNKIPLNLLRLTFEPQLGDGPEYTGYSSQQIIYPMFPGVGSQDLDLGATAMMPAIKLEVQGKYSLLPSGDALFPDIIEDVFKSGQLQAAYDASVATTKVQHGLNCYDYPIVVQQRYLSSISEVGSAALGSPLSAGDIIFVASMTSDGSIPAAPTDSNGNTYTMIASGTQPGGSAWPYSLWYCVVPTDQPSVTVTGHPSGFLHMTLEVAVLRGDNLAIDGTAVTTAFTGSPGVIPVTPIATHQDAGNDAMIVAWTAGAVPQFPNPSTSDWKPFFNSSNMDAFNGGFAVLRRVTEPGTYSLDALVSTGGGGTAVVLFAVKSTNPRATARAYGNLLDEPTFQLARTQGLAYGLYGSLSMLTQKSGSDWVKQLCVAGLIAPVWSGFTLKLIPWVEKSLAANGAIYTAYTARGPLYDLSSEKGDFVAAGDAPAVTIVRDMNKSNDTGPTLGQGVSETAPTIAQVQITNRGSDYRQLTLSEPLSGDTAQFGPRKASPLSLDCVTTPTVGRKIMTVLTNIYSNANRPQYQFKMQPRYFRTEPMDLLTLTYPRLGLNKLPVRVLTIDEDPSDYSLSVVAERYIWGLYTPADVVGTDPIGSGVGGGDPGSVNTPIFLQPPARLLANQNQPELWIVVSASGLNYGGCGVLISTNGSGGPYVPLGGIVGSATTGITTADWPAAADPDSTNALSVDLSESNGELPDYTVSDENNFVYPYYVAGGASTISIEDTGAPIAIIGNVKSSGVLIAANVTEIQDAGTPIAAALSSGPGPSYPYELLTYSGATPTGSHTYTVPVGSGVYIRRGVFGAPLLGQGVDHPQGARFAFLDPTGVGILKVPLDSRWIGQPLWFKFPAVNLLGGNQQDESTCTPYSYTPQTQGVSQSYTQSPSIALSQALGVFVVAMAQVAEQFASNPANYNARTFTVPDPGGTPTTYYVTIYDPGMTGDVGSGTTCPSFCETSNAKVGITGYTYIGSITVTHAGGVTGTPGGWPQ